MRYYVATAILKTLIEETYSVLTLINKWTSYTLRPACWHCGRVLTNGPGDRGSISCRVIPKTPNMELDTSLLNTQHYKVRFKGNVEQWKERISPFFYTSVEKLLKRKLSVSPRLRSPTLRNVKPITWLLTIIDFPRLKFCTKTDISYQFQCLFGDFLSNNKHLFNFTYFVEDTHHASFSRQINRPTSEIKHSCPTTEFCKILTDKTIILKQK